jgi:hypothetical protein
MKLKKNVLHCYQSDNFAKYVFVINSIFNKMKHNYKDIFIFFNLKSKKKITIKMKISGRGIDFTSVSAIFLLYFGNVLFLLRIIIQINRIEKWLFPILFVNIYQNKK